MRSYPKVHHIGEPMLNGILDGNVFVEEKVDGSQFRIMIDKEGKTHYGSHRVDFPTYENNGMFQKAVDISNGNLVRLIGKKRMSDMYIFCEFVGKNKQNTLTYNRTPESNIIIFDIMDNGKWYNYDEKKAFADKYGFDCIPLLYYGNSLTPDKINELLKTDSYLGGCKVEGIVVKNYDKYFDPAKYNWMEGNFLVGKYVRQEFQELNQKEHAGEHTNMDKLRSRYNTEARWNKAIQKLTEEGKLEGNMKDLALLIPEVKKDVTEECKEDIKEELYKLYGKNVIGSSVRGLAEYYNKKLLGNIK